MKNIVLVAAFVFLGYTFISEKPPTPDTPAVVEGAVTAALRSASSSDRKLVSSMYTSMADIIERDAATQQISTTGIWRRCHSSALRLAFGGTSLPGKYPGLDTAVEQVLSQSFTLDDVAMTPELRAAIAAACREVAKQSGG